MIFPRLLVMITAIVLFAGCHVGSFQAPPSQRRLEAAAASNATSFDFAADPADAWDRMYVFGCYSSRASVEKSLGFSWPDFRWTTIETSDTVVLVVFVQNGRVVSWYEQPRSIDLSLIVNEQGYPRWAAEFDIDRTTGRIELKPHAESR